MFNKSLADNLRFYAEKPGVIKVIADCVEKGAGEGEMAVAIMQAVDERFDRMTAELQADIDNLKQKAYFGCGKDDGYVYTCERCNHDLGNNPTRKGNIIVCPECGANGTWIVCKENMRDAS